MTHDKNLNLNRLKELNNNFEQDNNIKSNIIKKLKLENNELATQLEKS